MACMTPLRPKCTGPIFGNSLPENRERFAYMITSRDPTMQDWDVQNRVFLTTTPHLLSASQLLEDQIIIMENTEQECHQNPKKSIRNGMLKPKSSKDELIERLSTTY